MKNFISRHIHSVWQLETLLCLKRANGAGIDSDVIAKELYISETAVFTQLAKFVKEGIIIQEQKGSFKYQPSTREMADVMDQLESLYEKRRVAVTDMIYRQSSQSMQSFSDAFDLKGDEH